MNKKKQFESIGSIKEEKVVKEKTLKELENAEKGVVMRFAPSPSGPMHLGHAVTGSLTSIYKEKYGGKFILRIEDTNSDNIYIPAYKQLVEDGEWIFGNVTDVITQSDRLEKYYDYAKQLLNKDAIYICTCTPEEFREHNKKTEDCPCRNLPNEEQQQRWVKMFNEYKQGDAVVRFKAGMQHKNPALRDFPLLRINESEHPKTGTKYKVWPLMNFSVTVDDIDMMMTHIIRAKDHQDNAIKQKMIYDVLGKKFPETYFTGKINFIGLELSSSKTKEKIEAGEYEG